MNDLNRSVTLTLTADDYVAANKLFILKYATSRWPFIFWLGFAALLLGMVFVPALQMHEAPFAPIVYIGFAVVIALPFFQYFVGAAIFCPQGLHGPENPAAPDDGFMVG